jgi:hypothetical protein
LSNEPPITAFGSGLRIEKRCDIAIVNVFTKTEA